MLTFEQIRATIQAGDVDSSLEKLANIIRDRRAMQREATALRKFAQFQVGDTVRFNGTCSPQYLRGAEGKIVAKRQKKVVVDLFERRRKFHRGIITPTTILEAV